VPGTPRKSTTRRRGTTDPTKTLRGREAYVPTRTGRRKGISGTPVLKVYPWPPPPDWTLAHPVGTEPEWAIYWAHNQLGLFEGIDFTYQDGIFGHSTLAASLDFLEYDPPLAIEVQGEFAHYKLGASKLVADLDRRLLLESLGFPVIFIDEPDAERDPVFYLTEALKGIDHSKGGSIF
jgi:very-short-patch-repair endonuclease